MYNIELYKICKKEDLVALITSNQPLCKLINKFMSDGAATGVWTSRVIMEESPMAPIPVVVLASDTLNEFSVQDIVQETFPDYDFVDSYMCCNFRITALKHEQLVNDDHYVDVTEVFEHG